MLQASTYHEFQRLRDQAMRCLDRSLIEGNRACMESFLEGQIALDPPPIDLLCHIADDARARLTLLLQHDDPTSINAVHASLIESICTYIDDWLRGLAIYATRRALAHKWAFLPIETHPHNRVH